MHGFTRGLRRGLFSEAAARLEIAERGGGSYRLARSLATLESSWASSPEGAPFPDPCGTEGVL